MTRRSTASFRLVNRGFIHSVFAPLLVISAAFISPAGRLCAQTASGGERLYVCMYEAPPPPPSGLTMLQPVYPGVAVSQDGGRTWSSIGWNTSRTNDIAGGDRDPDLLYLAVDQGLLRSTDTGKRWRLITDDDMGPALCVSVSGDTVMLGAARGFFISTDKGDNWEKRCNGLPPLNGAYVSSILAADNKLIIGTADGIYSSGDKGGTWRPSGLQGRDIKSVRLHPERHTSMLAVASDGELHLSTDGGADWKVVSLEPPGARAQTAIFDPQNADVLLVGTNAHGILRSEDSGRGWTNVSGGLSIFDITELARHPAKSTLLYAGSRNGTYISESNGAHWRILPLRMGAVSAVKVIP